MLPGLPTPARALERAMKSCASRHRLARPTKKGWALVDETEGANGLEYKPFLTASIFEENDGHLVLSDFDAAEKLGLREKFVVARRTFTQQDMSAWLCALVANVHAVALREVGGVYFVPRTDLDIWQTMMAAVKEVTAHKPYKIPAMQSKDATEAILAAVEAEAAKFVEDIEEEMKGGAMGSRAMGTKRSRIEEMVSKVGSYESLLGAALPNMQAKLKKLHRSLAGAAMLGA